MLLTITNIHSNGWLRSFLMMKITLFLLMAVFFNVAANTGYSQQARLNLKIKDQSFRKAMREICKQSDLNFVYESRVLADVPPVSFEVSDATIYEILDVLAQPNGLEYEIEDHTVILRKAPKKEKKEIEVSGKVTDDTGAGLPGATVIEVSTTNGTVTDIDGNYSLTVSEGATLQFSFVGYLSQEIAVGSQAVINVEMQADVQQLEELMFVGYGTLDPSKVSGAIASAPVAELQDFMVSNFDQALAGKMAGVQVLQTTGEPGRELSIKIRGTGSITSGADPLYVVDGVPLDNSGQATEAVNMEDIASIEVLKDAASASIYGSRGANGVILIATKKGQAGKMKVSVNSSFGFQEVAKKIEMMNAYEYAKLSKQGHDAAYLRDVPTGSAGDDDAIRPQPYHRTPPELLPYLNNEPGLTDTDWQDEIFRRAFIQRYSVSVNGGSNKLNYYVSVNHSKQEGIIINSDYQRTGLRTNLKFQSGKFNLGLNLSPSYTSENRVSANDAWHQSGVVQAALSYSPTWPVYNPDGGYNFQGNGFWRTPIDYQHNEILNPVAIAREILNRIDHYNLLANVFAEYELLEGLNFKSSFGINFNAYQNEYYRPTALQSRGRDNFNQPSNPEGQLSNTDRYNWLIENTLNYKKAFGSHSLDVLAGITAQKDRSIQNRSRASVTPDTPVKNALQALNAGQNETSTTYGRVNEWSLYSLLARVQYNYDSRYIVSTSLRSDASSRFGKNNKWGYFPSASVAWRLSQESFLQNHAWINELKLRASYGLTGNFQIGNYETFSEITPDNYVLGTPGNIASGLRPSQLQNLDLSWEKNATLDIGLDAAFFNGQLGVTLDYYNANTTDLLLDVPVPYTTGFGQAEQNLGKVNNTGYEAAVNIMPDLGEFKWTGNFNISINRNEVKALGPNNTDIIKTAGTSHAFFITRVGRPIGSYYLLVQDGIFATPDQLEQYPHFSSTQPGDFRFVDVNKDGELDVNTDRAIVGNYAPDFTYGFFHSFKYKGFDLNVAFQGSYGGEILNLSRRYIANSEGNMNNMSIMTQRWQSETEQGNLQINRANRKATGNNGRTSTWHVENGSYLRLQNASLGYTLPQSLTRKIKIDKVRVYITGNNLYTWMKYTGYNPEVNLEDSNQLTPGLDYGVYPLARSYAVGLNMSF